MNINKNVTLTPKAQWSLLLFLSSFIISIITTSTVEKLSTTTESVFTLIFLPAILLISIYSISIILGLLSLKTSKFPLIWIFPCLIMVILLAYTSLTDYSRLHKTGVTQLTVYKEIDPQKAIGVSINSHKDHPTQIIAVFLNSPAEKSGLKNGDIIVSIGGKIVNSRNEIVETLNKSNEHNLDFKVIRNGKEEIISVVRELL